jgi:hypothetical protein
LTTVLQFKPDAKYTVRLLDDKAPISIWRHACRDSFGKFVKALCIGDRNGCKLCKVNAQDKYTGLKNKDKPYPKASEYAKAVWVYEEKRPMLIVGNDIWRQLDVMFTNGINLTDRDFSIIRTDKNKQVSYQAISLSPSAFTEVVDESLVPTVESYVKWLTDNIEKVALVVPSVSAEGGSDPAPSFLTERAPAPASVPAAAPQQASGGISPERQKLNDELAATLIKSYVSAVATACQAKVLEARKAVNPNCSTSVDFDKMSDAELGSFITLYKKEVKIQ